MGRPRLISTDDEQFIVATATTRPEKLGRPFTRWSIRKLADHLLTHSARRVRVGRERLRQILHRHRITFQRTKTWKESTDPDRDAKLARIEYVTATMPWRVFAFDEFGPLVIRPQPGSGWAPAGHPDRLPANYRKLKAVPFVDKAGLFLSFGEALAVDDRQRGCSGRTIALSRACFITGQQDQVDVERLRHCGPLGHQSEVS
ncbi:hypothetical protein F4553_001918 [Allocatelliglobosispora scoriae]|uniref:Transposase n=1 Tax=Allocatelliglobosispora scoriae TaxID=643052 RepID=A0A841BMX5_9ACTN|nr:hypothetical protein [Allocatelliglobosispora scoriae]